MRTKAIMEPAPHLSGVYFDDYKVTYTPTNIVQYNEYYPYSLQTATSWTRENATGNNFLGNGGTELNLTSGLYDLEYRNYDPALARMHQVDPMADKYASYTPYNYSFNAPSNFNDVNGADPSPGEKDYIRRPPLGEYHSGNDFSWLFRGSNMMSMFDRGWSPSRNTMADVGGMTGEQYSEAYEIFNNGKSFVPEFSYKEWVYPDGSTSLPYDVRLTGFVMQQQQTQGNLYVTYSINYDNDLPTPTKLEHLGNASLVNGANSYSKNSKGGYDINIVILINLNKALKQGSDFLTKNPGLDIEVLAHERGHVSQFEDALNFFSIVDLMNSGLQGDPLDNVFQGLLRAADSRVGYLIDRENDANTRSSQFLSPGYQMIYNNRKTPIKW